jgi:hypothetical protein
MRGIRQNRWHYCLSEFLLVEIRWRRLEAEKMEVGQLVRIILKYVREDPETAHKDMQIIAQSTLAKALPRGMP